MRIRVQEVGRSGTLVALLGAVAGTIAAAQAPAAPRGSASSDQVAPILVRRCLACHDDRKASGGLSMATFAVLRRGGKVMGEAILEPGDPDSSELIASIQPGAPVRMPYKQPALPRDEIAVMTRWVKEGAAFDGPSSRRDAAGLAGRRAGRPAEGRRSRPRPPTPSPRSPSVPTAVCSPRPPGDRSSCMTSRPASP